jgi:hypothetical protein
MRGVRAKAAISLALAALAFAPTAAADRTLAAGASLAGRWEFRTGPIGAAGACDIAGSINIERANAQGVHPCRFESIQTCPNSPIAYKVAQSCTARVTGNTVSIVSRVERIISVEPAENLEAVRRGYAPDNFTVRINTGATEMIGRFYSHGESEVRFWRPRQLTS